MKLKHAHVLAIAFVGLGFAVFAEPVSADSRSGALQSEMRKACVELGGRFEQSWSYNDQSMQWGRVMSCSTSMRIVSSYDDCPAGFCCPVILKAGKSSKTQPFLSVS